jgi:hypothetical protein
VNCHTGESYVLADENDLNLIPNSIFSDSSGFTHDYYSGSTANVGNPTQCLGISQATWATEGPVTKPRDPTGAAADLLLADTANGRAVEILSSGQQITLADGLNTGQDLVTDLCTPHQSLDIQNQRGHHHPVERAAARCRAS